MSSANYPSRLSLIAIYLVIGLPTAWLAASFAEAFIAVYLPRESFGLDVASVDWLLRNLQAKLIALLNPIAWLVFLLLSGASLVAGALMQHGFFRSLAAPSRFFAISAIAALLAVLPAIFVAGRGWTPSGGYIQWNRAGPYIFGTAVAAGGASLIAVVLARQLKALWHARVRRQS